jgi:hypothetical protein
MVQVGSYSFHVSGATCKINTVGKRGQGVVDMGNGKKSQSPKFAESIQTFNYRFKPTTIFS